MNLTKRPFGATGLLVSPLGFGGAPIGFLNTGQEQVARILNFLLDQGVNVIDTAAMYQGSEELIGRAISHRRQEFILISKCGPKIPEFDDRAWSQSLVEKTVDRTLARLKTDSLDVMLLHSCDLPKLRQGEAMAGLVSARAAGKIRHIGYSGDNEAAAFAATLPEVEVIQTSINIADQANLDQVMPLAISRNLAVMAKRPIANAAWKSPAQQPGVYADYAKEYHQRLQKMRLSPAELGISGPPEAAWPELALRFTLSQPGVHTAIVGTTKESSIRDNLTNAAKGPLPAEAVEKIKSEFARAHQSAAWPGQQ